MLLTRNPQHEIIALSPKTLISGRPEPPPHADAEISEKKKADLTQEQEGAYLEKGHLFKGAGVSGLSDFWLRDRVLGLRFYSFWASCLGPSAARRCKVVLLSMSLFG